MKKKRLKNALKLLVFCIVFVLPFQLQAQEQPLPKAKNHFWEKVQFGGGFGLGISSGYTNILVAPSGIYNVNNYFSVGLGMQYSYLKQRDFYNSSTVGGSVIGLVNPVEEIQLSIELEQLRVHLDFDDTTASDNFWNTGLFFGAGYRSENVVIGARYNVLFIEDKGVYGDALIPFIRVFF
jgi:long-subunit fatty acid transport protein